MKIKLKLFKNFPWYKKAYVIWCVLRIFTSNFPLDSNSLVFFKSPFLATSISVKPISELVWVSILIVLFTLEEGEGFDEGEEWEDEEKEATFLGTFSGIVLSFGFLIAEWVEGIVTKYPINNSNVTIPHSFKV